MTELTDYDEVDRRAAAYSAICGGHSDIAIADRLGISVAAAAQYRSEMPVWWGNAEDRREGYVGMAEVKRGGDGKFAKKVTT